MLQCKEKEKQNISVLHYFIVFKTRSEATFEGMIKFCLNTLCTPVQGLIKHCRKPAKSAKLQQFSVNPQLVGTLAHHQRSASNTNR